MAGKRRTLATVLATAVLLPIALSGCGDSKPTAAAAATPDGSVAPTTSAPVTESATVPVALALTPGDGQSGVPISAEIGLKVSGGKVTAVTLKDASGKTVGGELREDASTWVPGTTLKAKEKYTATAVATAADGHTVTSTTSFTTMAAPAKKTGTGLYLFDGKTYGVAMPVVVEFSPGIKKADRAAVQKRLFVTTSPAQPGVWSWTDAGTQAYYRAKQYWTPGTTITVRSALGGVPTGGGRYGDRDRSATSKIGRDFEMKVDNASKKMTVLKDGQVVKTMPVSLGKHSTPSSSGTMVVMDKAAETVFDTTDDGPGGYKVNIQYAQRLTWSGQYIHSAPWSTGAQGHTNVSHGCVNVSPSNAKWLFDQTLIGDPVTVKGTEDKLDYGNGWTPWDLSWDQYVKGSALPVPADLA